CDDINQKVKDDIDAWVDDNKPSIGPQLKVITIGVHGGFPEAQGSSTWPQDGCAPVPAGALCETSDVSPISHVDVGRPLTSVAHETFHDLGRPHADPNCGGKGPSWPPDQRGDLDGIGLDRHPGSGGSVAQPYNLLSPDVPGQDKEQYDIMSYCSGGTASGGTNCMETCAWISPRNWDAVAGQWVQF